MGDPSKLSELSSYGHVLLYEAFFKAKQSVTGIAGMLNIKLGKRAQVGKGSLPLWLFERQFDFQQEVEAWEFPQGRSKCINSDAKDAAQYRSSDGPFIMNTSNAASSDSNSSSSSSKSRPLDGEYAAFLHCFRNIMWLTYRSGFIPMQPPSSFVSDAGWGCMLRSAQMLLAEVLVRHLGAKQWGQRDPASNAHRNLIRWFLDAPKYFAFYSIHRMTECGRHYGKRPGEWYGPNTVALVIRDLVHSHRQRQNSASLGEDSDSKRKKSAAQPKFLEKDYYSIRSDASGSGEQDVAVLVTDDSATLYLDDIYALCQAKDDAGKGLDNAHEGRTGDDPLIRPKGDIRWSSALFVIIPLRLGLNSLNSEYIQPLIQALRFPQCVGMIGGKPAHSLYFVGSQGDDFVYLDPHTVQPAASVAECDDEFFPYQDVVNSYHCMCPRLVAASTIDPSLAVGFFCRSALELVDLVARLGQLERHGTPFMAVMQTRPKYNYSDSEEEESADEDHDVDKDGAEGHKGGPKARAGSGSGHGEEEGFFDACETAAEAAQETCDFAESGDEFVFL